MSGMIRIDWLTDTHDCETCGYSVAEGASVFEMRDAKWEHCFTLKPSAHCYGGDTWDREQVYRGILEHMGFEVIETE